MKKNEVRKMAELLRNETNFYKAYYGYYTEREMKILTKYLPKRGKILDAGGGVGRLSIPLAKLGYNVTLIDLVNEYLKIAKHKAEKEKLNISILKDNIRNLKFEDEEFDAVIVMRDVINYCCKNYEKGFSEVVRVCKKNGIIILSSGTKYTILKEKNIERLGIKGLYNVIAKDKFLPTGEGYSHKLFTLSELESMFKQYKINIIEVTGDSIVLPMIKNNAIKILSNKNNVKMIKEIDRNLSLDKYNLNFFDHIILVGKK